MNADSTTTLLAYVTSTSWTNTGLTDGATYTYKVQAKDTSNLVSGLSGSASATAGLGVTPPSAFTLSATAASPSSIALSWTAATDNFGSVQYRVFRGTEQIATGLTTMGYTDSGLAPATPYNYEVRAYDAAGLSTARLASATTLTADNIDPTAPANLKATVTKGKNARVNLTPTASYDAVGVTQYQVFRTNYLPSTPVLEMVGLTGGTTTSFSQALPTTYNYTYYVVAVDATGNVSNKSNTTAPIVK